MAGLQSFIASQRTKLLSQESCGDGSVPDAPSKLDFSHYVDCRMALAERLIDITVTEEAILGFSVCSSFSIATTLTAIRGECHSRI